MRIEVAEPGRMTQSGSSLLKLIQNNDMPILDLLVRESIQNSLDAYRNDSKFVKIEFLTGEFNSKQLNSNLEGVGEALDKKFKSDKSRFIAIKDSNTKGLTGKMHYDEVENNDYGNLLKLVYEISKAQESPGAGGSWGLGKTVYFRIGIGLVVYYSRILNENNKYESRLAVSMVEDEKKKDAVIPNKTGKIKRGIAWWGEGIGNNKTKPITNEKEINDILNIFGIKSYSGSETGTTIIIPYVDSSKLLESNRITYINENNQEHSPFWYHGIDEYIRIAVQRWFTPRLNNPNYKYGKYLKVFINGSGIGYDNMEPVFKILQSLYNRAADKDFKEEEFDALKGQKVTIKPVNLKGTLKLQEAGRVAHVKVNKNILKMSPPNNKENPFIYVNKENTEGESNKPIVMFSRKPGMVVSYETTGPWNDSLQPVGKDEYILGMFVLNSNNIVTMGDEISLEEYVRKSEMADHTSWNDWSNGKASPAIIRKIQGHVRSSIAKTYENEESASENKINSGLSKLLGDILLPPENFGKKATAGTRKPSGESTVATHKGVALKIDKNKIKYKTEGVTIPFNVKSKWNSKNIFIDTYVVAENGRITAQGWEKDLGLELPYSISRVKINSIKRNKSSEASSLKIDNSTKESAEGSCKMEFIYTSHNVPYGVQIVCDYEGAYELDGIIEIKVKEKGIKTALNLFTEEGVE